jgi:hypothetical protein
MKMYAYRFELADGSSMIYKTQGLFSNTGVDDATRLLIKSAIIVDEFEQEDAPAVEEVKEEVEQAE